LQTENALKTSHFSFTPNTPIRSAVLSFSNPTTPPAGGGGRSELMTGSSHYVSVHILDIFHAGIRCDAFCFATLGDSNQNTAKPHRVSEHSELEIYMLI